MSTPGKSETERLFDEFVACTLPKEGWTHQAHLHVGLWHLLHHGSEEALELLRGRIWRYNEASGGANTNVGGYHETITRFYVWAIDHFLSTRDRTQPVTVLAAELIGALGDRDLPLRYWSHERLYSTAARRRWVEPDVMGLEAPAPRP